MFNTKTYKRTPKAKATVLRLLQKQRGLIVRISLAVFVLRLSPVLLPVLLRFTLDPILQQRSTEFFHWTFSPRALLLLAAAAGLCVAVIRAIANYHYLNLAGRCGHKLVSDIRVAMYQHILRLPVRYVDRRGTGKVLLRFIGDSDALRNWVSKTQPAVMAERVIVVVLGLAMLWLNWRIALIVLSPLPVWLIVVRSMSPRLQQLTRRSRLLQAEFTGHVQARFDEIRQTKWFDANPEPRQATARIAAAVAHQNVDRDRWAAKLDAAAGFITFLCIPALIWFGISFVWNQRLTTGGFVAFAWIAAQLAGTLQRLSSAVVIRQKAEVSLQRIERLLARSSERGRSSNLPDCRIEGQSLRCEDLVFSSSGLGSPETPLTLELQGPGIHMLDPMIDFRELTDVLLGFRNAGSGRMVIDGQAVDRVNLPSLRRLIGVLPQHPALFEGTVEENIRLAAPSYDAKKLTAALIRIGLAEHGLATFLGKRVGPQGDGLSKHEIRLIAEARLLVHEPKIVLVEGQNLFADNRTARVLRYLAETELVLVGGKMDDATVGIIDPIASELHISMDSP